MDAKTFFDVEGYFSNLCQRNKLAKDEGLFFCTCSGIESLQGPLNNFRKQKAFVCVDDTNDGTYTRGRNGGYFKNRTMTIFILHRYEMNDMADRSQKLDICRTLARQIISRMLVDKDDMSNEMIYLQTNTIYSRELGQYFMSGCTGLYIMADISEPVDLKYSEEEWDM